MKKVMLVEDEELIIQGIQKLIPWDVLGLELTHTAYDGEEALRFWDEEPVDIIITDIEMPEMNGLELLERIRKKSEKVKFIILTGYEKFTYVKEAIGIGVEDYLLKPINEHELESRLRETIRKIEYEEMEKVRYLEEKTQWLEYLSGSKFLGGGVDENYSYYHQRLRFPTQEENYAVAIVKWRKEQTFDSTIENILLLLKSELSLVKCLRLVEDSVLIIFKEVEDVYQARESLQQLQNKMESTYEFSVFISIGGIFNHFRELPTYYHTALRLQKYLLIEGYGSCVDELTVRDRKSQDIYFERTLLRKYILQKANHSAIEYIDDLFINNMNMDCSIDSFYEIIVEISMLLQEIKKEYKLDNIKVLHNLPDLINTLYEADDIYKVRTVFISEINAIIQYLHEEDSQYTPVVKSVIAEVQKNYKEDMNLKTLSHKYYMNASYLGQIFLKEVGCSFAQYLNSKKMEVAKELILNTNMKMSDIAKEVGYSDISYFYRKFKQYYGTVPASLREMKK